MRSTSIVSLISANSSKKHSQNIVARGVVCRLVFGNWNSYFGILLQRKMSAYDAIIAKKSRS